MQDIIDSGAGLAHRLQIGDIRLTKVNAIPDFSNIVQLTSSKIVDAAHLLSTGKQLACNRRSDESSDPCNQVLRHDKHHTKVSKFQGFKVSKGCRVALNLRDQVA